MSMVDVSIVTVVLSLKRPWHGDGNGGASERQVKDDERKKWRGKQTRNGVKEESLRRRANESGERKKLSKEGKYQERDR